MKWHFKACLFREAACKGLRVAAQGHHRSTNVRLSQASGML